MPEIFFIHFQLLICTINRWFNQKKKKSIQFQVETQWGLDQQFVVDQVQNVFAEDSLESSLPLSYDNIQTPDDISDRFGGISYGKGGSVIRMFKHAFGESIFYSAIQKYLRDKYVFNLV